MASSSGAAHAPPPTDQLAAFYKLVDKRAITGMLGRHARDAELSASAAVLAKALFGGDDSLVVANLRINEIRSLANLATVAAEASGVEQMALLQRAWPVLLSVIPLLLRRVEANTLLPGTVREEELDYEAHTQAAANRAENEPVPSPSALRALASTMGYETLLLAIFSALNFLSLPLWPTAQKRTVESFVLQGLDVIPRTAGIKADLIAGEGDVVAIIEENMLNMETYTPGFCAAVLRKWRSNAVSSVLRARGVLQTGINNYEHSSAEFKARQDADIAMHGLRDCALPSCSKAEMTVKEFAGCSGCRSVVYCCLEHQALDWRAHKKACRVKEAAQLAAAEEVDNEASTGAATA